MSIYKQAAQLKLRVQVTAEAPNECSGMLSVEQLFGLGSKQLVSTLRQLAKKLKRDESGGELSFLNENENPDTIAELSFNIVKDIYLTKKEEQEKANKQVETKAHNAKIDAIIARKKETELDNMSIEELENLRK